MTILQSLANIGQAIWLDYIQRSFISSGVLEEFIKMGLRGMTSNPTIFEKAIQGSQDYDLDIERFVAEGLNGHDIYERLAIDDIQKAADLLHPVYEATEGADGYVSLEVNPNLANATQATLSEAKRLWAAVERPNLMIKIPATLAGLPAIRQALAEGVNVNVTLIFSLTRYNQVMEAYIGGLEERIANGKPIGRIASVASFFVSRVDSKVDKLIGEIIQHGDGRAAFARSLLGKAAVANAKLAYSQFRTNFGRARFEKLMTHGARFQRPLWASTSTKNPAYSDILYVQELIGANTVNTLPQNTLDAFIDHGEARVTIEENLDLARQSIENLETLGISMDQITQDLEKEGVEAFATSFSSLLESIDQKRQSYSMRN
jgi:transaldolase